MTIPETRYALARDGVCLAHQVIGDADIDLLWLDGLRGNLEVMWEQRDYASFFTKLSRTFRVIRFDMRGTGLSDRGIPPPSLEAHMDDALTVLEAVGSQRTIICGHNWGSSVAALFASTFPRRTRGLVLIAASARNRWAPDYPWGFSDDEWEASLRLIRTTWGTEAYAAYETAAAAASMIDDRDFIRLAAKAHRHWVGPTGALALNQYFYDSDVREVLRSIRVPSLVVAKEWERPEEDEYVASLIPGARLVRLPGADWLAWLDEQDAMVACIASAAATPVGEGQYDRVLATFMFTDIVASTARSSELGDHAWGGLVEAHHGIVRHLLAKHRGVEVDTAGDGFFATFDGPARAIRCAQEIERDIRQLGLEVRAGVHTGECETIDGKVGGISVVIGSRIGALAGASEVLVSQTVKDLVAGSGLTFESAGEHELKGVPNPWRLYRVLP